MVYTGKITQDLCLVWRSCSPMAGDNCVRTGIEHFQHHREFHCIPRLAGVPSHRSV